MNAAFEQATILLNQILNVNVDVKKRDDLVKKMRQIILKDEFDHSSSELEDLMARLETGLSNQSQLVRRDCAYLLGWIYTGRELEINSITFETQIFPSIFQSGDDGELSRESRVELALNYFRLGIKEGDWRCAAKVYTSLLEGEGSFPREYRFLEDSEIEQQVRDYSRLKQFFGDAIQDENNPASVRIYAAKLYGISLKGINPFTKKPFHKALNFPTDHEKGTEYLSLAQRMNKNQVKGNNKKSSRCGVTVPSIYRKALKQQKLNNTDDIQVNNALTVR